MRFARPALPALLLAASAASAPAQDDPRIVEIRAHWTQCERTSQDPEAPWTGWRRDFGNGYADSLEFFDNRFFGEEVSVLVETRLIDAIASETTTSCFRPDGSLAFVFITMAAPSLSEAGEGPVLIREGRIYLDPDGHRVAVLGRITDAEGTVLGTVDDTDLAMARGCSPVDLRLSADDAERQVRSVLGDIEGTRPGYEPNLFDWCREAAER